MKSQFLSNKTHDVRIRFPHFSMSDWIHFNIRSHVGSEVNRIPNCPLCPPVTTTNVTNVTTSQNVADKTSQRHKTSPTKRHKLKTSQTLTRHNFWNPQTSQASQYILSYVYLLSRCTSSPSSPFKCISLSTCTWLACQNQLCTCLLCHLKL